jgi:hypothetical protein
MPNTKGRIRDDYRKVVSKQSTKRCAIIAIATLTMISGCGASKEETEKQLQHHISAYERAKITPVNAKSIVNGIDLLTSSSKNNNFREAINENQFAKLEVIRANAESVASCTEKLNNYENLRRASPNEIEKMAIYKLESTLAPLESAKDCVAKADVLSQEQVTSLENYTEEISKALQKAQAKEAARKAAEEAARKAAAEAERRRVAEANAARDGRINRFIARTGLKLQDSGSYEVDKMRKDIDRAMLRALERNCENWLPSSCMREYGITIYEFDLVREKLGL